jgi:polar amino acid transport system substrate-binding protein
LLFIDVDRFKNINDSLGHGAGDDVLVAVSKRLTNAVPDRTIVGRISGDEFVVLDPLSGGSTDAIALADRVLSAFREPLSLPAGDVFVSASIGVAVAEPNSSISAEELLRNADTAMYRAKDAGRNCVAVFDESMLERVTQRLAVETALYRALERRELRLVHQPIIDIEFGDVLGFEALMRWEQEDGTTVSPAEFIPIAEETGIIQALGEQVLAKACRQIRAWIDLNLVPLPVAVNVSALQFASPELVNKVARILRENSTPPELIELELTETTIMQNVSESRARVDALRDLGIRISIDDFGTGYSSLAYLQQLPLDSLKVDRSFIKEIRDLGPKSDQARALVQTIVALGHSLGVHVVAEGIENEVQAEFLRAHGCHRGQGYHFSKPVPPDELAKHLRALELA